MLSQKSIENLLTDATDICINIVVDTYYIATYVIKM